MKIEREKYLLFYHRYRYVCFTDRTANMAFVLNFVQDLLFILGTKILVLLVVSFRASVKAFNTSRSIV